MKGKNQIEVSVSTLEKFDQREWTAISSFYFPKASGHANLPKALKLVS